MTITQQQIIALAVEAGFDDITPWLDTENVEQGQIDAANRWIDRMTVFAALIGFKVFEKERQLQAVAVEEAYQRGVRDERMQVIAMCENEKVEVIDETDVSYNLALDHAAAAIRARSDK